MRTLGLVCLLIAPLCAQERFVSGGVLVGAEMRNVLEATSAPQPLCSVACYVNYSVAGSRPLTIGVAGEMRFTRAVAVEGGLLYQSIGFSSVIELASPSSGLSFDFSKITARRWSVPVVAKWRLGKGAVRPFILGGGALDWINSVHAEIDYGGRDFLTGRVGVGHRSAGDEGQMTRGPRAGPVLGGGIEFHAGPVRFAPQIRYTRWIETRFAAEPDLLSRQSDVAALVSVIF